MDTTTNKPPVFHNRGPEIRREQQKANKVIDTFAAELKKRFIQKQSEGRSGWDNNDPENLLYLRKQLVKNIKEGMLDRKDQENDIALLACFVWFNRLEVTRRAEIEREWG